MHREKDMHKNYSWKAWNSPRYRCEDNIKTGHTESVNWIKAASGKDPVANCCEHGSEYSNYIKGG
jgi:hypothetical protein